MANNRMWLKNKRTGARVLLAKYYRSFAPRQRTGAAMSIDFDRLIHAGGTFVATPAAFDAYTKWLATTSCAHCGAKYADRERDAEGKYKQWWLTEADCGCRLRASQTVTGDRRGETD